MARIDNGCLYVTKSIRIPVDVIYRIIPDGLTGCSKVISDRGTTYVSESIDELEGLLPDLCHRLDGRS